MKTVTLRKKIIHTLYRWNFRPTELAVGRLCTVDLGLLADGAGCLTHCYAFPCSLDGLRAVKAWTELENQTEGHLHGGLLDTSLGVGCAVSRNR